MRVQWHTARTLCFLVLILASASRAQAPAGGGAGEGASAVRPADGGWPRSFEKAGNRVLVYQPQVEAWQDFSKLAFHAAIELTPAGAAAPAYGVLEVKANTLVDHEARLVFLTNISANVRLVDVPKEKAATLDSLAKEVLPQREPLEVSLDRILACMKGGTPNMPTAQVNMAPPAIYHAESPAILVVFVGNPQLKPINSTGLSFVANTNWDILLDQASSQYYLRNGNSWLTAPDPLKGPWTAATTLPEAFSKLPADANWQEVRQHIPGEPAEQVPMVLATTAPAELIATSGAPQYVSIPGTSLSYINNPLMPVFLDASSTTYYYLVAGRWFQAQRLDGPWAAASTNLPTDFTKIPSDSPVSFVLASVPKTQQSEDAVLLASVPHKATIDISKAQVNVTYDGDPRFAPIAGTDLQSAVNSPQQVILAGGQYYCCYQGVWFSAPAAAGPWAVCTSVPDSIYSIPPTSPLYNVTYVKVYGSTPSTVDVGYTSGYEGEYLAPDGVLVFGSGNTLPADSSWYACSPAYYSYGCAANYSYAYGGYYGAAANYGPYGGAGHGAVYNPATGIYSRGAYAYGPAGAAGFRQAYNPNTGNWAAHAGATNGYQSWGRTAAQVGDTAVTAGHHSGPGGSAGWAETSTGRQGGYASGAGGGTVAKGANTDLYASKDGNVYRKTDGGWQSYSGGSWQNAEHQGEAWNNQARNEMNRESQSRSYGNELAQRTSSERGNFERGGGGSDRGGGGFEHSGGSGGGGRRR